MNTTKAIYWIALGAFALALNSEYQSGGFPAVRRVAGRAESVLCRAASHAEQSLAMAGILAGRPRPEFRVDGQLLARQQAQVERVLAEHQADIEQAMALRQAELDRVQQRLDRVQAVLERTQFRRNLVLERSRFKLSNAANRHISVICPKTGKKISVNTDADLSDPDNDLADIQVGDSF
jgi:hypothetical protein